MSIVVGFSVIIGGLTGPFIPLDGLIKLMGKKDDLTVFDKNQ
ncbi:MAG: hypothetical protein ACE5D8_02045 [Fidelibacterota bacterium]